MQIRAGHSRDWARIFLALLLLVPVAIDGQMRGRRGGASAPTHPEAFKGVVVTFHGTLKKLTKKEIMIESREDNHELVTFRRNKATKFLENDAEIKPALIDLETVVTVDASEDIDLKLMAVSVSVGSPKKTEPK